MSNLGIRIIGSCAEGVIPQFKFYPGEAKTLTFQVYGTENDEQACVSTAAIKQLTLSSVSATDIIKSNSEITQDAECPSIFSVDLDSTDTNDMMTGSMTFQFTVGSVVKIAKSEFVLKRMT